MMTFFSDYGIPILAHIAIESQIVELYWRYRGHYILYIII